VRWDWPVAFEQRLYDEVDVNIILGKAGRMVFVAMFNLCPVDTGYMRSRLFQNSGRDGVSPYVDVGTDARNEDGEVYAHYVEFGVHPHDIFTEDGRRIRHPGQRANPFMRTALQVIDGRTID
jgi:hypothetical protein